MGIARSRSLSFTHTADGVTYRISFAHGELPLAAVQQALSRTPLQQDLGAARRIHRFITQSNPRPTAVDLWSALVSEGLTERLPLGPDITDPIVITMAVFQHLEDQVADYAKLRDEVRAMQAEIEAALQNEIAKSRFPKFGPGYSQPLGQEEIEDVAPAAEVTIDHTLARLFLRLGPPPEDSTLDYTPAGRGGGGAQQ